MRKFLLITTALTITSPLFSQTLIPGDSSKIINNLATYTPPQRIYSPDEERIIKMANYLSSGDKDSWENYLKLCSQATQLPKLGMTFDQARASTWCFPHSRNKTTNRYGEFVQEVYLKNQKIRAEYSGRKYLYFTNGILTSIQE